MPEGWRIANITPVFKNGKKDPGQYRPVSLISIPQKAMEQLVLDSIFRQLEEMKVIRSSQHAFTRGRSCLTSLVAFCDGNDVITSWVDVVYLDFS